MHMETIVGIISPWLWYKTLETQQHSWEFIISFSSFQRADKTQFFFQKYFLHRFVHKRGGELFTWMTGTCLIWSCWIWWHSHKTVNNKLNWSLALRLCLIMHQTEILKYFDDIFCIFIIELLWTYSKHSSVSSFLLLDCCLYLIAMYKTQCYISFDVQNWTLPPRPNAT